MDGLKQVRNPGTTVQGRIRPVAAILPSAGNEEQIGTLIKLPSVLTMLSASVNLNAFTSVPPASAAYALSSVWNKLVTCLNYLVTATCPSTQLWEKSFSLECTFYFQIQTNQSEPTPQPPPFTEFSHSGPLYTCPIHPQVQVPDN